MCIGLGAILRRRLAFGAGFHAGFHAAAHHTGHHIHMLFHHVALFLHESADAAIAVKANAAIIATVVFLSLLSYQLLVWLYGGTPEIIAKTIADGRGGRMPAHAEFLGEAKVHLLAAYVFSLSQDDAAKAQVSAAKR